MTSPTKRKYWFRQYPKLTLSAFALFGCVVFVILAELSARAFRPSWAPIAEERAKLWVYDGLLGWAHMPNQRARFNHRDFSVEVVINSQGMRDSEYSVERTGKRRMLVLGDSYGWGFGVEHHERFSEILENIHPDWEIINASVSGYGTDQEFLFLKAKGMPLKPDVVLLLFYVNDFENNVHGEEYWHFKPYFVIEREQLKLHNVPVPKATINQQLEWFFLGRTYLGQKLYFYLDKNGLLGNRKIDIGNRDKGSGDEQRMNDVTYHLITSMNDLCKKSGSLFVLVSIPLDARRRTFLQKLADAEKIAYLPLDAPFESTLSRTEFPHDAHWNAKGHELAANAIDAFLWESRVFDGFKSNARTRE